MRNKCKSYKMTILNFRYTLFFRGRFTSLFYTTSINLCLIVLTTPSMVNPGPATKSRPLSIFYSNVQGLIPITDLKSKTPRLNMTKLYDIQTHIFKYKPDIVVLNETWLKRVYLILRYYQKVIKYFERI